MKKKIDYQEYLIESLKKPEEAAGYLNAALSRRAYGFKNFENYRLRVKVLCA